MSVLTLPVVCCRTEVRTLVLDGRDVKGLNYVSRLGLLMNSPQSLQRRHARGHQDIGLFQLLICRSSY